MAFIGRIAALQLMAAMLALVVMGSITVADVALKYLFARPIAGAYDVIESLLPVVVFMGLPATLLRRQNIAIDLIDGLVGPDHARTLIRIADAAMLAMLALLLAAMWSPAVQALEFGDRKLELGLPVVVVWAAAMLGLAGCVLVAAGLCLNPKKPS